MNTTRLDQCLRKMVTLLSSIVPMAVLAFAICSTSTAQTAPPASFPSPDVAKGKPELKFKVPKLPTLQAGIPTAFNLCSGNPVKIDGKLTDAQGQEMDTKLTPCNEQAASSTVAGGNPPYHFQFDSGSFPPLGMHLGMNGLLYGTPYPPPLGGYKPFRVCAVDLGANADCHEMKIEPQPAANPTQSAAAKAHSNRVLVMSLLGLGGVAAVVGVHEMNNNSGSSTEAGTCSGLAPANACGACSCTDNGTCNNPSSQCGGDVCYWAGPGTAPGQAPFCP